MGTCRRCACVLLIAAALEYEVFHVDDVRKSSGTVHFLNNLLALLHNVQGTMNNVPGGHHMWLNFDDTFGEPDRTSL